MKKIFVMSCILSIALASTAIAQEQVKGQGYEAQKKAIEARKQQLEKREQALEERHEFKEKAQNLRQKHIEERKQLMEQRPEGMGNGQRSGQGKGDYRGRAGEKGVNYQHTKNRRDEKVGDVQRREKHQYKQNGQSRPNPTGHKSGAQK